MKIKTIITGATGMVGKGVLLECLESPDVESVLTINRRPVGITHPKIKEVIHADFLDLSSIQGKLKGYNACFFCMGVSVVGLNEEQYTRVTYTLTVNFARIMHSLNPDSVFIYVSGTGTNENGRAMWARVKGRTESAIFDMGFRDAYAFRPGLILPEKGIRSKTGWYNAFYDVTKPFFPLMKKSSRVTTTTKVGQAMIKAAIEGFEKKYLVNADINALAKIKETYL